MAHDDIDNMLDQLRRIRSGGDLNVVKINQIESLEMELRFLRTFIKYYHVLLPYSLYKITMKTREIEEMLREVFYEMRYCDCETCFKNRSLVSQLKEFFEVIRSAISRYENDELNFPEYEENDFDLLECLDYLNKNLNDAPRYLVKSDPFFTKEIKVLQKTDKYLKQLSSIQKKMRFVRYLYGTEIIGCIDHEKLKGLQTRIQFMVDDVRQFCFALWMNDDEDNTSISDIESKPPHLLCLVVLVELEMKNIFLGDLNASKFSQSRTFKNQKLPKGFSFHLHSFLLFLRNKKPENFPNNVCSPNIDVAIEFLLDFLDDVSNRVINGKMLSEVSVKVGALVVDVLCVIQKLLPSSKIIKDNTSKINLCSIQILENTKILKAQVESYYKSLKFTPSQFPILGGLSFLDSLLRKLNEMSKSESGFDFKLKAQIGILEKELSSLTSVFRDVAKVQHENEIHKDLQKRTINLAYEAEVAIDSILVQHNALWHSFCSLPAIINEFKHIHMEVIKLWSENFSLRPSFVVEPLKSVPIQHSNPIHDEEIVGFENDREKIFQHLIRGTDELDVIPIVGMGGQGKTTIARKVYNNDKIVSHFDVQVWCIISQTYNRRDLLQEIFSGVTGSKDKGDKDDILAEMVKKSLTGKRYLIVLDDMWDGMAWDDVRFSFPDVGNRSRIIVTTRLGKVGEHVKHHTDLYFLPFLTREESCQLLQKKVFQQDCPPELCDVSLEVAERCNGLPLVVVLVAGIIKRKKMEESWWREVEKSLPSSLGGELEEYSLSTIQLSYDNLPDYLRPCLLYMGMFQEDATIPVSKLISLWIAEGFVQNTESGRLEEAAEDYLMDLISSNVVMVSTRRYNGKVKYCQVHDVVLHFCLEKGRGEKFMLAVKGRFSHFQPSDWKEHRLRFNITNEFPKMSLMSSQTRKPFNRYLRSLIITSGLDFTSWTPIPQISKLGLLKVLDLSSRRVDRFSSATLCPLIHLKYLAVYSEELNIYPEPHLLHLETLIVKCFYSSLVPASFWKMEKLRHVEIGSAVFDLVNNKQRIFEESTKLEYLSILRKVEFSIDGADCIDVLSRRCPNLQELETTINFYEDSPECRLKLEGLTQLQQLDLCFNHIASELHLPSNLKKLALTGPDIVSAASLIAGLPNLEYLKVMDLDYESTEWLLGDIVFDKLKFLKLVDLGISSWVASEDSFPLLETLVIRGCDALTEIPLSFVDIQTLKQITLILCEEESLKDSAVQIKKEVEEIEGIDRLSLIIIE